MEYSAQEFTRIATAQADKIISLQAINKKLVEACQSLVDYTDKLNEEHEPTDQEIEEFDIVYNKAKQALSEGKIHG